MGETINIGFDISEHSNSFLVYERIQETLVKALKAYNDTFPNIIAPLSQIQFPKLVDGITGILSVLRPHPLEDAINYQVLNTIKSFEASAITEHLKSITTSIASMKKDFEVYQNTFANTIGALSQMQIFKYVDEITDILSVLESHPLEDAINHQILETIKFFESSAIAEQLKSITASIASNGIPALLEVAKAIDLSKYNIDSDGNLTYKGVEYTQGEVERELDKHVKNEKEGKHSLREKYETLKKKLWFIIALVQLVMILPELPSKYTFYTNLASEIEQVIIQKERICFTIKERTYLRERPNSSARITKVLKYDTPLEILDDIPRWYQVKYTDDDGLEVIAWISKISVETED